MKAKILQFQIIICKMLIRLVIYRFKGIKPLKFIIGQININSIRNKFVILCNTIQGNIDMVSKTKPDDGFPQFCLDSFSYPYILNRNIKVKIYFNTLGKIFFEECTKVNKHKTKLRYFLLR